jgi:hypothetical protein
MTETFEATTLRLIHEAREKLKQAPEGSLEATEIQKKIKDLINDLLWWNEEYVLSNDKKND